MNIWQKGRIYYSWPAYSIRNEEFNPFDYGPISTSKKLKHGKKTKTYKGRSKNVTV